MYKRSLKSKTDNSNIRFPHIKDGACWKTGFYLLTRFHIFAPSMLTLKAWSLSKQLWGRVVCNHINFDEEDSEVMSNNVITCLITSTEGNACGSLFCKATSQAQISVKSWFLLCIFLFIQTKYIAPQFLTLSQNEYFTYIVFSVSIFIRKYLLCIEFQDNNKIPDVIS